MAAITSANTTLEYFDGFDDYSTAQATRYWNGEVNNNVASGGIPSGFLRLFDQQRHRSKWNVFASDSQFGGRSWNHIGIAGHQDDWIRI